MRLRSIYSELDIKTLKQVVGKTIEILEQLPSWDIKGWTELELKARIQYEIFKSGKPSFETIVASGKHSADPHHNSSLKRIKNGVLLIDMGINVNQIKSDITWTYWVGGKAPDEFLHAYSALCEAKNVANNYMISGQPIYQPALKCREILEQYGYDHRALFMHSLGHPLSVGDIMKTETPKHLLFEENMAYTNEPGLYWQEKYGIRLEMIY